MDMIPQKYCSACNNPFPATSEFFYRNKSHKDGLHSQCKTCKNKKDRAYLSRPEVRAHVRVRRNAYQKTYYSRPEVREKRRAWESTYIQRPEVHAKRLERDRTYRSQPGTKERTHAYDKARRSVPEIREKERTYSKAYISRPGAKEHYRDWHKIHQSRPETREQKRVIDNRRRARKIAAPGTHTAQDIQAQFQQQKGKCYWCDNKLTKYHVDHIIPLSRGGSNWPDNLVIACPTCNVKRGNKMPHEFYEGGKLL